MSRDTYEIDGQLAKHAVALLTNNFFMQVVPNLNVFLGPFDSETNLQNWPVGYRDEESMKLKELLFTKILSFYIDFSSHYEIYYNVHATIHRKPRKFVVNDIDEERRLKKKKNSKKPRGVPWKGKKQWRTQVLALPPSLACYTTFWRR